MVAIRSHARRWGAYGALGVAAALLWQSTAAQPPRDHQSAQNTGAVSHQSPQAGSAPSAPSAIEGDAKRIAGALESKNAYDQSPKGQQDAHEAAQAARDAANWAKGMLIAAWVETLVTAAGVVLVGLTLREVKITAAETKNTATAASNTLAHVRLASTQELRAYVSFQGIDINWASDDSGTVQVIWKNTGQTPIRKGITQINLRIENAELPKYFDYPDLEKESPSRVALGGSQEQSSYTNQRITKTDIARIEPLITFIDAWGWIEYNDGFESTKRHRTEFSAKLKILGGRDGQKQIVWDGGNVFSGADEDCYRKPTT